MLAPEELDDIRDVADDSLSGVCTVSRVVRVRQPNGSFKDTPTTIYTDIPCRKVPSGQTPQEQALMRTASGSQGIATFLLEAERVLYSNDTITYRGMVYAVAGVHERTDQIYARVIVYDKSVAPAVGP